MEPNPILTFFLHYGDINDFSSVELGEYYVKLQRKGDKFAYCKACEETHAPGNVTISVKEITGDVYVMCDYGQGLLKIGNINIRDSDERDIDLIMDQCPGKTRDECRNAYVTNDGDIVNAIMDLIL